MKDIIRQLLDASGRIWIEPSFLLHEGFLDFWDEIQEELTASGDCLWLRRGSFEKIQKTASSPKANREKRKRAVFVRNFVREQYVSANPRKIRLALEAPGQAFGLVPLEKGYVSSDSPRVTVLTQENKLIQELFSYPLAEGQELDIYSLNAEGELVRREKHDGLKLNADYAIHLISGRKPDVPGAFSPSNPGKKIIRGGKSLSEKPSPEQGEMLMAMPDDSLNAFPITLGPEIATGGEGTIYQIVNMDASVAKVYAPKRRTSAREQKVESFLKNRAFVDSARKHGICVPTAKLVDSDGLFMGFIMDKAQGQTLEERAFQPRPTYEVENRDWDRATLIRLCKTILRSFSFLHQHQVLVGDINPYNFLVDSPDKVYFVDVDSYQFLQFPCEVGVDNFLAPELQYSSSTDRAEVKKRRASLRPFETEFFSIAIMLFMILIPGKFPYSQTGEESALQNLLDMQFPYPYKEYEGKNLPDGIWAYAWWSLPDEIQEDFYNTFSRDGVYARPEMRLSPDEWIEAFDRYEKLLPELVALDAMNGNIFPSRNTRKRNVAYATCRKCSDEYPLDSLYQGYCPQCLSEVVHTSHCTRCGAEIPYTFQDQIDRKAERVICEDCEQIERMNNGQRLTCEACGQHYWLTDGEKQELEAERPGSSRLCPECRSSQREQKPSRKEKQSASQIGLIHFLDWTKRRTG